MSKEEAEKYFANDDARRCKATEYAKNNGAYVTGNGCSWWWLRSPNPHDMWGNVLDVDYDGDVSSSSVYSIDDLLARPALWINL